MSDELPHNRELEREVNAFLFLLDGAKREDLVSNMRPDFFSDHPLKTLYEEGTKRGYPSAMAAYDAAWTQWGEKLQVSLSRERLTDMIASAKGKPFMPVIEQLRKLYIRRVAIINGAALAENARLGDVDLLAFSGRINNKINDSLVEDSNDSIESVYDEILDQAEKGLPECERVAFNFDKLDKMLRGFRREDFLVVSGIPNAGKTPFAINLLLQRAKAGYGHQLLFSLEMSKKQITQQLISIHTGIPQDVLVFGLQEDQKCNGINKVQKSLHWLMEHFSIVERAPNIEFVRAVCAKKKTDLQKKGKTLDTRMVDYLQLLGGGNEELTEWTRFFKMSALEDKIPWVVISSMNREFMKRQGSDSEGFITPLMSDLRDCGNIEYDATKISFLLHWMKEGRTTDNKRVLWIAKNKFGPSQKYVPFDFNYPDLRFSEGSEAVEKKNEAPVTEKPLIDKLEVFS